MRTTLAILVCLSACGSPEASTVTAPAEPAPVEPAVTSPPAPLPPPAPEPLAHAAPPDFAMSVSGGPVAGFMAAGLTEMTVRLVPHPDAPGAFDLVEASVTHDSYGVPGEPNEVRRVVVPPARVAALHTMMRERLAELEAPCADPSIMDGAVRSILVHADGADHQFTCSNATTPAFDALSGELRQLEIELGLLPPEGAPEGDTPSAPPSPAAPPAPPPPAPPSGPVPS